MKIKIFNIRLSPEHFQNDQELVNNFLEQVIPQKTNTQFVTTTEMDYWSAIIFYNDKELPDKVGSPLLPKIFEA